QTQTIHGDDESQSPRRTSSPGLTGRAGAQNSAGDRPQNQTPGMTAYHIPHANLPIWSSSHNLYEVLGFSVDSSYFLILKYFSSFSITVAVYSDSQFKIYRFNFIRVYFLNLFQ